MSELVSQSVSYLIRCYHCNQDKGKDGKWGISDGKGDGKDRSGKGYGKDRGGKGKGKADGKGDGKGKGRRGGKLGTVIGAPY